ncbi:hypothetical protein COHA_001699 [Chlorella ohadii]|uniref:Uncharacterized protein n=1 Tax=Chlorella ohadii TaxID=2649997 RepID=A0AAD5H8P2_9CHLO|nr:hypothetical protein COHA_001699 [Chlorella ohadii]
MDPFSGLDQMGVGPLSRRRRDAATGDSDKYLTIEKPDPSAAKAFKTVASIDGNGVLTLVELSDGGVKTIAADITVDGGTLKTMSDGAVKAALNSKGEIIKAADAAINKALIGDSMDVKGTVTSKKVLVGVDNNTKKAKVELSESGVKSIDVIVDGGALKTILGDVVKGSLDSKGELVIKAVDATINNALTAASTDVKGTLTSKKVQVGLDNNTKKAKVELSDAGIKTVAADIVADGGALKGTLSSAGLTIKSEGKTMALISNKGVLNALQIVAGTLSSAGVTVTSKLEVVGSTKLAQLATSSDATFGGPVNANKSLKVFGDTTLGDDSSGPKTVNVKGKLVTVDAEMENATVNNKIETKTLSSSSDITVLGDLKANGLIAPTCFCRLART